MSENEKVGYKRPPKSTRFRPGESGNPAGRPKRPKTLFAALNEELERAVTLRESGQQIIVTKKEALVRDLLRQAISGNLRAHSIIFSLCVRESINDNGRPTDQLAPEDLDVLRSFINRDAPKHVRVDRIEKSRKG